MRSVLTLFAAMTVALLRLPANAATADTSVIVTRIDSALQLDGALLDSKWKAASSINDFTDATSRTRGTSPTTVSVLYDEQNLYVAFWCKQSVPITANQTVNDVGFGTDDYVGVGIDPTGNGDRAYYFELTPAGTRFQQATESARYTPRWQGAAKVGADGWTAMLIVPFDALNVPPKSSQAWRMNLVRYVAHRTERLTWSFSGMMDTGAGFPALSDARYWAHAQGLRVAASRLRRHPIASIYGLASAGVDRARFTTPYGTLIQKNPRVAGLDLIYPLTSTVSFVGALAPDFSNVDADQITITPQVFPRSLAEYRPFFSQGQNFINNAPTSLGINQGPDLVFYSPSIGAFDRGFKIEGTYGRYQSLGMLEARGTADSTGLPFDDFAFGYKHVLPGRTFAYWTNGVVANHGPLHDAAAEIGVQARDLRTGLVGALFHEREFGTRIADASQASSTFGFIAHQNGNHEAVFGFRDIGALYNPVDGFTYISDIHGPAISYALFGSGPPHSIVLNANLYAYGARYLDKSGEVHKADAGTSFSATLRNKFDISLSTNQTELRSYAGNGRTGFPYYISPKNQRFDQSSIGIGYATSSPSPLSIQYSWGPFGDFYLQQMATTMTRALGNRYTLSAEYDGTRERMYSGPADGQWLRRASFVWAIDRKSTLSIALRNVSGEGGFAAAGNNFSGSLHRVFDNGNELYISVGAPAADRTVNRYIIKYVLKSRQGSGS